MPASEPRKWNKKRKREPQVSASDEEEDNEDLDDNDQANHNPSTNLGPVEVVDAGVRVCDFPCVIKHTVNRVCDNNDNEQANQNPSPNLAPVEVVDAGVRISDFPNVLKHTVIRFHPSVLAIVATERAARSGDVQGVAGMGLENVSHGQLQAVSAVPRDFPLLMAAGEMEKSEATTGFVVTPPKIVEGRGVVKRFGDRVLVVPMHADWFSPHIAHRLERQVVPHFFSGKSTQNTPEKYMEWRNRIVAKYMENPEKRLTLADCQERVTGFEKDDLIRVIRFLDHWGIINYCPSGLNKEPLSNGSSLREDSSGEIHVPSAALKSIDSLIQFDNPKCKLKATDIYPSRPCHDHEETDLDNRIREHLSDNRCNFCSRSVPTLYYQSQKEGDLLLCVDCYNDGRFIPGHSSIDFVRIDASRDYSNPDGESWTNQETLLLLEAVEIYNDNWNEIAQYVGTKSKAQCILHFIRLPTEDGPLENVQVPSISSPSYKSNSDLSTRRHSSLNGDPAGSSVQEPDSEREFPFASSANPVMALVAFLASSVGPRVAAACAQTCLEMLAKESRRTDADAMRNNEGYPNGEYKRSEDDSNQNGEAATPLSADKVTAAAKAALAAAATKAKLFADHEEREIQRLSANIINHQLKRLELKLKQFAEVETQLMKECEQVERLRQRFISERARVMSAVMGNSGGGTSSSTAQLGIGANNPVVANRQPVLTGSSQPFISPPGFNNNNINQQQMHHPHQFMMSQQQQQMMYGGGLGPRLPLSALRPSTSATPNANANAAMFNSPPNTQSSVPSHHPMLRSLSGASSSLG